MKKLCVYCGRIHDKRFDCGKKPKKRTYRSERGSRQQDIRATNRWKEKSVEIRERDHYLCQACLHLDHRLNSEKLSVHHIVPIAEDESLAFDECNLITLCDSHHEAAESGRIDRGTLAGWVS